MNDIPTFESSATSGLDQLLRTVGAPDVPRPVALADEMMQVFLNPRCDLDRATLEYFRSGANMAQTIGCLISAGAPEAAHAVLDFGSGYGRVMRFLTTRFGAARFWASDVYAEGLAFQAARFGVHPLLSHTDPARFPRDRRFRVIFSISVFTHLPAPAFDAWLRTLLDCLEPGGLLAFTVHDEAVLNVGDAMPESGILFLRQSESRSLSTEDYGSTWVNERFLRGATERVAPGAQVLRLPRAICDYQDLVVVAPPGSSLPAVSDFAVEPTFFLEGCAIDSGSIELRGWTFSRPAADGRPTDPVRRVSALLTRGGEVLNETGSAPLERPDVPAAFGPQAPLASGFALRLPLPEAQPHAGTAILVSVTLASGARFVSYAAPLASALLDGGARQLQFTEQAAQRENGRHVFRERHLERDIALLQGHVRAMESTLTWRIRRRLRRLLGLPPLADPPRT